MRFSLNVLALLSLVGIVVSQDIKQSTVKKAFYDAKIPFDLGINFDPTVLLEVSFPVPEQRPIVLRAGIELPRRSMRGVGAPNFSVVGAQSDGPFVIALIDPDAPIPQKPTSGQVRHFLGSNFMRTSENTVGRVITNTSAATTEFVPLSLPEGSDAHRYVFLLFDQPSGFESQGAVTSETSIEHFDIHAFAKATKLGNPIGGTFMFFEQD